MKLSVNQLTVFHCIAFLQSFTVKITIFFYSVETFANNGNLH